MTAASLAAPPAQAARQQEIGARAIAKRVVGYFVQWGVYQRNYHVKNIRSSGSASKLTHINYAFGNVSGGRCVLGDTCADYDRFYDAASSVDGTPDTWEQDVAGPRFLRPRLDRRHPGGARRHGDRRRAWHI
ncbi:hypothetical protein [Lentzea sp. NBC_00516]|uniref:hypothetical protein n=1 Tax=Lentzea sp. NBC_00516 TaxID=2903582 RepID=UPI003FA607B0